MKKVRLFFFSITIAFFCDLMLQQAYGFNQRIKAFYGSNAYQTMSVGVMRKFALAQIRRMTDQPSGWISQRFQKINDFYYACEKSVPNMVIILCGYISGC